MKTYSRKILSLLTAMILIMSVFVVPAAAADTVSITIDRDDEYGAAGITTSGIRDYYYFKVFSASYDTVTSSGGGVEADGTPMAVTVTPAGVAVSYYLSTTDASEAALVSKLGSWDDAAKTWTKASGNNWFELTKSADGKKYTVSWTSGAAVTAENVQAAASWLYDNSVYTKNAKMTYSDSAKQWTASGLDKGYYLLKGSEGQNLVAATADITVKEKNSYPTITKKQKDEDASAFGTAAVNVAIGDVIEYLVTVKVTADANQDIVVTDKLSEGLSYDSSYGLVVSPSGLTEGTDYVKETAGAGEAWKITIKPTAATKGKNIEFSFKATVGLNAITADSAKKNTVTLNYNGDHYVQTDEVSYKTYYSGIKKVDGSDETITLDGVKFTLEENGSEFKVSRHADGYYYFDAAGSAEVETTGGGLIVIRGLDEDKTYTLIETETLDGYNPLDGPVTLVLHEDNTTSAAASMVTDTYADDHVLNNKGIVLPATGGIGTTIFYVIGTILVLGAGAMLVAKKKAGR